MAKTGTDLDLAAKAPWVEKLQIRVLEGFRLCLLYDKVDGEFCVWLDTKTPDVRLKSIVSDGLLVGKGPSEYAAWLDAWANLTNLAEVTSKSPEEARRAEELGESCEN